MQKKLIIPDLGNIAAADVIAILVKKGDRVQIEDPLLTLESDKASMDIPSSDAGTVIDILTSVGSKVKAGEAFLVLDVEEIAGAKSSAPPPASTTPVPEPMSIETVTSPSSFEQSDDVHAGPIVRRIAKEFDIDLRKVKASGEKGRILKEDVQAYVRRVIADGGPSGLTLPSMPAMDFAQFGPIESKPLPRLKKLTGEHVHRAWMTIPHVTQFDEADITDLEVFRREQKSKLESQGIKLTPLVFLMKAVVACLKAQPLFNCSLDASGGQLIQKNYYHLGVAVDTPDGLVVPVIRNVDQKGLIDLAKELTVISEKARNKKLMPADMQGSCFTLSSLGGIGGTAFTPIVNAPDVAILGISKSQIKPVYREGEFKPRLMLPLSLSYDHRVIDGAEGARFTTQIRHYLSDVRQLLL